MRFFGWAVTGTLTGLARSAASLPVVLRLRLSPRRRQQ
jgi:hypothetical protein